MSNDFEKRRFDCKPCGKTFWRAPGNGCRCPHCGVHHDASTDMDDSGASPAPGDFTFCFSCTGLCVFDHQLGMRLPTVAEVAEAEANPEVARLLMAFKRFREARR